MNKRHEKILYMFSAALDAGDFVTISEIWETALNDEELTAQLVNLGLAIDEEDMQTIPLSNGKVQPVAPSNITPLAPNAKPYVQRRKQTWVAAIFFMILMGGVLLFATLSADDSVHTTIIQQGVTPTFTPTVTPFYNPIHPTNSYTTHDPILENGKGILSFQYPDTFRITEDNENGIRLISETLGTWIMIVPPGDTRTDPETSINEGESFDDFVQRAIEETDGEHTMVEYMIEDTKVVEITTHIIDPIFFSSATSWILDTPQGPLALASLGFNPHSQLSRDIAYEMLSTIQFDAEVLPTPLDYSDLADQAVEIELEVNTPLTANFTAQERGLVYSFEGVQDEVLIVNATTPRGAGSVSVHEYIYFYLLDNNGQVIDKITGETNDTVFYTQAIIVVPEDGSYQLLVTTGRNRNRTFDPIGGSITVEYQSPQPLLRNIRQSGTMEQDDTILSAWMVTNVDVSDILKITTLETETNIRPNSFVYPISELNNGTFLHPIGYRNDENFSRYSTDSNFFLYHEIFENAGDYLIVLVPSQSSLDNDLYPVDYQVELTSESTENE